MKLHHSTACKADVNSSLGALQTAHRLRRAIDAYRDLLDACAEDTAFERCIVGDAELALDSGRGVAAALRETLCELVVLLMNRHRLDSSAGRLRAAEILCIDVATLRRWRATA